MIDVKHISGVILHKAVSKDETVGRLDKRTSVAINTFGPINGQAYVQIRNRLSNKGSARTALPPDALHDGKTDNVRPITHRGQFVIALPSKSQ